VLSLPCASAKADVPDRRPEVGQWCFSNDAIHWFASLAGLTGHRVFIGHLCSQSSCLVSSFPKRRDHFVPANGNCDIVSDQIAESFLLFFNVSEAAPSHPDSFPIFNGCDWLTLKKATGAKTRTKIS
jgi:hypothetical protein